jgi:hypothetical protein
MSVLFVFASSQIVEWAAFLQNAFNLNWFCAMGGDCMVIDNGKLATGREWLKK